MNLRHAAALALVGWYLMIPAMVHKEDWPSVNRPTAPLSEWFTWNWFDTADACTKARSALLARGEGNAFNDYRRWLAGRAPSDDLLDEWASTYSIVSATNDAYHRSMCVATDDPRLNSN
jgi:hypothetical protein